MFVFVKKLKGIEYVLSPPPWDNDKNLEMRGGDKDHTTLYTNRYDGSLQVWFRPLEERGNGHDDSLHLDLVKYR